jgi:opacity protein-like surface antigen
MKTRLLLAVFMLMPYFLSAQFEQKVSVCFGSGTFFPTGAKTYEPEWYSSPEDLQPTQMPNYRPGLHAGIGLQYNMSRNLSFRVEIGLIHTEKWFYAVYDDVNYMDFWINDSFTDEVLAEGSDELTLSNISLEAMPVFYLNPGKKLKPYLFAGISINLTSCEFTDNVWMAYKELGMLDPVDPQEPSEPYLESNIGPGLRPGFGLDNSFSDRVSLNFNAGYHYVFLKEGNFKTAEQAENLKAISILAGLRLSFMKSKKF